MNLPVLLVIQFALCFFIQYLVLKYSQTHPFCIDRADADKPQSFHDVPTSRAGGLGIFIAILPGMSFIGKEGVYIALSAIPVFMVGFYEDLKSNISPKIRLAIISTGAIACMILMDSVIYDIGVIRFPYWIAVLFTIFAVTGVSNSINIIDGFNGLASGVSIIAFSFFALTAYIHGDPLIFYFSVILIATIAGFFVWNFPKGKIFLGDGGAYVIGFLLAEASVLLAKRNPDISPWFPLVILAYPIFEVVFSMYRRKFTQRLSPFEADRIHLHTLIYKRISRNNPKTSVYIWIVVAILGAIAFPFHSNTPVLIFMFIVFAITYIYIYRRIVQFKWL
jgi:UDP-N-acetylmuramyl pentapeptide phosphotransferase/UDP-N-acetylglucosamine-1-phosphate transferase